MAGTDESVRLDHYFDALLFGDPLPLDALDPRLAATLVELRESSAVRAASASRLRRSP